MKRSLACRGAALLLPLAMAANAAPVEDEALKIRFPERVAGLTLSGRTVFPDKGAGSVIAYESAGLRGAVYVYDGGIANIPTGAASPVLSRHFLETTGALGAAVKERNESAPVPIGSATISSFQGCGPQFMWRAFRIRVGDASATTRTYLTAMHGRFVKLRVSFADSSAGGRQAADDFVQEIRRVLGQCG